MRSRLENMGIELIGLKDLKEAGKEIQPGVHVRNVNGKCLADDKLEHLAVEDGFLKFFEEILKVGRD